MRAIEERDYEAALSFFDEADKKGENVQLLERGRGIARMGLSEYKKAAGSFQKALSSSNGRLSEIEYDCALYMAVAKFKNGKADAALEICSNIIDLQPKRSDALFLRGKISLSGGDYEAALRDFNAAIRYDSKNPDLYLDIYECMEESGHGGDGGEYLKDAMELTSISAAQKGRLYLLMGDYDSAREQLEKAGTDGNPAVMFYLARTYEALGDETYAASLYEKYMEYNPQDAEVCNKLGLCYMEAGEYDKALKAFEGGIAASDGDMKRAIRFNEIVTYEHLSDFERAKELISGYLEDYPDDENAKRESVFLSTR